MKFIKTTLFLILVFPFISNAQDTLRNYTDINGMKQGYWLKKDEKGSKVYEGYFKNNVPVGKFIRYHENGRVKAEMFYDSLDQRIVRALLYDDTGELAGKGMYFNKMKDKTWYYYGVGEKLLVEEQYDKGKLNGTSKKYYPSGSVVEVKNFKNGQLHGEWNWYYEDGKPRMKANNLNDKRSGDFIIYYPDGKIKIKGAYKDDRKEGHWIFYTDKGAIEKELDYVQDVAENQEELDKEMCKELKEMDTKQGQYLDPQEYIDNPDGYINGGGGADK